MLRKCHGHGLTKGEIIRIFYHGLYEPTQEILDVTAGGIFLYKSPNQAFKFLDDKVLFKLDWSTKSQNKHHQKSIAFADGSNNNNDNSRLMEKLEALTIKMDSQFQSLKEEMHEMRKNYNNRGDTHASENRMNDDTPMCEHHEVNYIQSKGYQNQNSNDSYSHQSHYDLKDSEKSLIELNNDVRNDLEHFKRRIRSMRTVHDKLFDRDDQSKTDLEKSITKFLDGQRVSNMTGPPPPPQAQTKHVNVVFTGSGESDDSPKTQKDPPPPIIVNNKIKKDKPIKTSKKGYYVVETKEYPFHSDTDVEDVHIPTGGSSYPSSSFGGGQNLERFDDYDDIEDQLEEYPCLYNEFCDQYDFKVKGRGRN
ncbi:hypothetical protein Tco_0467726 [Tanacetum coccineum]